MTSERPARSGMKANMRPERAAEKLIKGDITRPPRHPSLHPPSTLTETPSSHGEACSASTTAASRLKSSHNFC